MRDFIQRMYHAIQEGNVELFDDIEEDIKRGNIAVPVLFLSGSEDAVGDFTKGVQAAEKLFEKAEYKDIGYKIFPEMRHDVLHEKNSSEVLDYIRNWIEK